MKIVVMVKHVPDAAVERADRSAVPGRLDEIDENSLECAMQIAERRMGVEVIALTMGPARAAGSLRRALAFGPEYGVHVRDDALRGSDVLATALVLARAIDRIGYDLVIAGAASGNSGTSLVPAMVAEHLGVPALCYADEVRLDGAEVVIRRDAGDAVEEVAAPLPAVVSVTDVTGELRYPSFRSVAEARRKTLLTWSLADLKIDQGSVGAEGAATAVRNTPSRSARKSGIVIRDDAGGGGAARLADFLTERQFL